MKMTKCAVTFLAASAALVSQAAMAAPAVAPVKLTQVQGDVMVNNGTRFVKAVPGLEIKPGAKIVTAKSSNVSLVYQNGCVKQLNQNTMHTVGTPEQCAAGFSKEKTNVAVVGDNPSGLFGSQSNGHNVGYMALSGGITAGSLGGLASGFSQDSNNRVFSLLPYAN